MSDLFLNDKEIEILTGYRKPKSQREWLRKQNINFFLTKTGKPIVIRETIKETKSLLRHYGVEPNFEAI